MQYSDSTQFTQSIYHQYIDEASFLYDQRLFLLDDPGFGWTDLERAEDRFETYIDGIAAGGTDAFNVCIDACVQGDAGTVHVAARVMCLQRRFDGMRSIMESIDPGNTEQVMAFGRGLAADMPADRAQDWLRVIVSDFAASSRAAAYTAGYHRFDITPMLPVLLSGEITRGTFETIIRAAGRSCPNEAGKARLIQFLNSAFASEHADTRRETAIALLRLGDNNILDICRANAKVDIWSLIPLGLAGNQNDVSLLLGVAEAKPTPDCLLALGLLGDIRVIPILLVHLQNDESVQAAALALWLITGAGLFEKVFIPARVDVRELFDDEREAFERDGTLPADMRGSTYTRITQNHDAWQKWWADNRHGFDPSTRYRSGKPFGPDVLIGLLQNPASVRRSRSLAQEELAVRYGIDAPFETDMFIKLQRQAIQQMAAQVSMIENDYTAGTWH